MSGVWGLNVVESLGVSRCETPSLMCIHQNFDEVKTQGTGNSAKLSCFGFCFAKRRVSRVFTRVLTQSKLQGTQLAEFPSSRLPRSLAGKRIIP